VDVQVDPSFEELDQPLNNAIPELVRLTAYRVVEEALLNAVRHGKAHKVVVRVSAPGRALTFVVQDDGQGFDTKNTPRGLGLQLMQARLHAVGGNLHISSFPELGTMVRASIRLGDFTQGEIAYTRGNNVPTTV
jgi:signal transduction histidine kinase